MRLPLSLTARLAASGLALLALSALAAGPASAATAFATFSTASDANLVLPSGGTWAITSVSGAPLAAGAKLTREGARVSGSDGCAALSGSFAARGLALDLPGITRSGAPAGAGCGGSADQVLAALQATTGVNVVSDGTLELTANGQPVLTMQRVFRTIESGKALQADPGPVAVPR